LYEINPKLRSNIPEGASKTDSNNGVSEDYTKLSINLMMLEKSKYSTYSNKKTFSLPRLMWVNKQTTVEELHLQVFSFLRHIIQEWIAWKEPMSKRQPKNA